MQVPHFLTFSHAEIQMFCVLCFLAFLQGAWAAILQWRAENRHAKWWREGGWRAGRPANDQRP